MDDEDKEGEDEETGLETPLSLQMENIEGAIISSPTKLYKFDKIGVCVSKTYDGLYVYTDGLPTGIEAFLLREVIVRKELLSRAYHGCWISFNDDGGRRP